MKITLNSIENAEMSFKNSSNGTSRIVFNASVDGINEDIAVAITRETFRRKGLLDLVETFKVKGGTIVVNTDDDYSFQQNDGTMSLTVPEVLEKVINGDFSMLSLGAAQIKSVKADELLQHTYSEQLTDVIAKRQLQAEIKERLDRLAKANASA